MGCTASSDLYGKTPVRREDTENTNDGLDEGSDVTNQIARHWLQLARNSLAIYRTVLVGTGREVGTPMFGLDTPGFGLEASALFN
jgi:hypothetical protein